MGPGARYVKQISFLCPTGQVDCIPQNMPGAGRSRGCPPTPRRAVWAAERGPTGRVSSTARTGLNASSNSSFPTLLSLARFPRPRRWITWARTCPVVATSRLPGHVAGTSALPPKVDIRAPKSAFAPISSASPPGADLPGGAPVRLLLTQSRHRDEVRLCLKLGLRASLPDQDRIRPRPLFVLL